MFASIHIRLLKICKQILIRLIETIQSQQMFTYYYCAPVKAKDYFFWNLEMEDTTHTTLLTSSTEIRSP